MIRTVCKSYVPPLSIATQSSNTDIGRRTVWVQLSLLSCSVGNNLSTMWLISVIEQVTLFEYRWQFAIALSWLSFCICIIISLYQHRDCNSVSIYIPKNGSFWTCLNLFKDRVWTQCDSDKGLEWTGVFWRGKNSSAFLCLYLHSDKVLLHLYIRRVLGLSPKVLRRKSRLVPIVVTVVGAESEVGRCICW